MSESESTKNKSEKDIFDEFLECSLNLLAEQIVAGKPITKADLNQTSEMTDISYELYSEDD